MARKKKDADKPLFIRGLSKATINWLNAEAKRRQVSSGSPMIGAATVARDLIERAIRSE